MKNTAVALVLILLATGVAFAQAARYPQIARAMARDGYAGRQKAAVERVAKESMNLNRRGFAAYEKKDFVGAAELFHQALAADNDNVFARYNLACALALARGEKDPEETPYQSRAALAKAVARLLAAATAADIHWLYKIFLDSDLDSLRGEFFSYEQFIPCPGDCCPDQWYTYRADGTVVYGAGPTDLSGLPGHESRPTATAKGWYAVIGDYVFVHVPGQAEILEEQWPGGLGPGDEKEEDGIPRGSLDIFQIKRATDSKIELLFQPDLWEEEEREKNG